MPAAVGVVLDAGNDAGLDGVLMDVTEEGGEVVHVVDGLAAETLLEEVAAALVLAVVIIDVSVCDALYGLGNKMGVGALMSQKRRCDGSLSNKQKKPANFENQRVFGDLVTCKLCRGLTKHYVGKNTTFFDMTK